MRQKIIADKEAQKDKIVNNAFEVVSVRHTGSHELHMQKLTD